MDYKGSAMKILTITSNDLGINYGPAIHYLELWNTLKKINSYWRVKGLAPSWTGKPPIIDAQFPIRSKRVFVRGLRQIFWDIYVSYVILLSRDNVVYIRLSSFHIFSILALFMRKQTLAVEVNGSAKADSISNRQSYFKTLIALWCERRLLKRAQIVFSVTEKLRDHSMSVNSNAICVHVPNGVSERFFMPPTDKPAEDQGLVGIYVGTFTAWDGAEHICEIARENPSIKFLMIGDGGRRNLVEQTAPENMIFLGWISYAALVDYYTHADFSIVLYENMRHDTIGSSPLKIREYLASSLPIFTSRSCGTEIVEDFRIGIRSSNYIKDFNEFLSRLQEFKERYSAVRGEIQTSISWERTAKVTAEVIEQAVHER